MTRDDDFIGQLEGYLDEYEGFTPLPAAVRDAIRAVLPKTRQIGSFWGPRRYLNMTIHIPNGARYGLAAAAVVVLAVIGIGVLLPRDGVGGPEATPTASPLPSPTASPVTLTDSGTMQALAPGTYSIPAGRTTPAKLIFTMPAGWETDGRAFIKGRGESGEAGWTTSIVGGVYTDTCAADGTLQPIGPSVDDLVNALEQLGGATVTPAVDTTVGGYPAKRVDIAMPDVDVATCRITILQIWADAAQQDFNALDPLQQESVYIIDAAGQVVVIFTTQTPDSSAQDIAEMSLIISSVQLEPTAP
jgi:hypothetical protein